MQRHILLLCAALFCGTLSAQVVLEDFEGGEADLPWTAFEGTYDGPVLNTADTLLNTSEWAGSYTKAGDRSFSFFVAQLEDSLDLSINNQYSIQINAGAATQLLLKLEGGGNAIERTVNIPVANVWRTYTFDFSSAAGITSLTDIILFFDPGVEGSSDTYLFDNLIAGPAGDCAGTEPDPTFLDDFECQRNASYSVGFDDIVVIENPDASGINTSMSVGQYTDRDGGFYPLILDYNSAIDLSVNNQFCFKVWAPVAGEILLKLEGGVSPAVEAPRVNVTETMTWTEVCADFSAEAAANHENLVIFFNAGVDDAAGDVYFIDDLTFTPAPPAAALEDFEDGASLVWNPLNEDNTLHGTFSVIANPDPTGGNTSARVGSYVRGSSSFSTLTATLLAGLDLSGNPQLNLDVWAPEGATTVTMQLLSALNGATSIEADVTTPGSWETLNFNFEDVRDVTDFSEIQLLFDPMTMGTGQYYFDNLAQGESTVDACADVVADADVLDDFECQRNANYTCCDVTVMTVNNPDITPANSSTKVGEVTDPPGAFNALVIDNVDAFDFSLKNRLKAKIWAPVAGQILFKLEGGDNAAVEMFVDISATNEWVDYEVDFSASAGQGHTRLVFFFGAGGDNTANETYFIDDVRFSRAPYVNDCVVTFEGEDETINTWRYFANGGLEGNAFIISENPSVAGINMTPNVGTFEEAADGEEFAGMFADTKAPIILPTGNKVVKIKMLMDVAGDVVLKLEGGPEEMPQSGDVFATYTTAGEWQELTFDMSVLPDDAAYTRITLIPNFGVVPAENLTHYFDDISVGDGACVFTSIFTPVALDDLRIFPNPVREMLTIDKPAGAVSFELTNMMGQTVKRLSVDRAGTQVQWEVYELPVGAYILTARAANGTPLARTKIIRE